MKIGSGEMNMEGGKIKRMGIGKMVEMMIRVVR